ncbi:hypothetical protein [Streptomyces tanashiensis]|uniref:hypothetical protein n=1 Tax=Streptomyces tanashiensis TaxID=67367 RepID=UPI003425E674
MESVGYLIGVLVWGAVIAALLVTVVGSLVVVRWRRRTIEALERAESEADPQPAAGSPVNRQQR